MMLALVRVGLPAAIATIGLALVILGDDAARGAGIVLIGVARGPGEPVHPPRAREAERRRRL
jgi:hypothetical protein